MTSTELTLVTGSSGNVGAPLVDFLRAAGRTVIETSLSAPDDPSSADPTNSDPITRRLDFEDPTTFASALQGVSRVFLMRPPAISDTKRYIRPFIEEMQRVGIEHVVLLSLMGVNRAMPHWQIEQDLKASSLGWTFLRPAFFAQNLGGAYRDDVRLHDRIRLSCGRGKTSFIDARDIAEVAATILADPTSHRNEHHTLTGGEAIDYHHVASMLSAALGRSIVYEPIGLLTYRRELIKQQLPSEYVNVQLLINVIARLGLAARVDGTLERLLGRPPTPLKQYIEDSVALWQR